MTALRVGRRLLAGQGRDGRRDLLLTAVGVAVPVALLVLISGVLVGLGHRDDHRAWREPTRSRSARGAFVQQRSGDAFGGRPIDRVDLAAAAGRPTTDLPAPPGLPRFPRAGEVFMSPRLATLARTHPTLAERWGAAPAGVIGKAGLGGPDDLVVVVGRAPGTLRQTDPLRRPGSDHREIGPYAPSAVVEADRFARHGTDPGVSAIIRALALIGAVLLAVPAVQLSAAAARFTTNRRAQRLAALRLAGATPGQVLTIASVDAVASSAVGALAGVALGVALIPVVTQVPLAGSRWFGGTLWPGALPVTAIVLVTVAINVLATVLTLWRAVRAPLGVVTHQRRRRPTAWRLLVAGLAWAAFLASMAEARASGTTTVMAVAFGAVIASLAVVGPWVTWLFGVVVARTARSVSPLLAGRHLAADPIGAFRPVAGIVLVGFVAGLMLTLIPLSTQSSEPGLSRSALRLTATEIGDGRDELAVWTPALRAEARRRVATVTTAPLAFGYDGLQVRLRPDEVERVRTALTGLVPGHPALTVTDRDWQQHVVLGDMGRAAVVATLAMVVLAVFATALSAAADILEQRGTLRALHLAGTPFPVLQSARRLQAALPLSMATIASVGMGSAAGLVLLLGFGRNADQLPSVPWLTLLGVMAAGPIAGLAAAAATRPLLRSATAV